ncbi:MAG TPA: ATP-binding protein [Anaerolineales bacterium]|nr:ATP-binding protein [Anaerolineales bacterium]
MNGLLGALGSLFTAPPGNVIYYLILAFSVAASLQAALAGRGRGLASRYRRTALGLGAMLAALILLVAVGIAAVASMPSLAGALPSLDRAASFILVTWAIWLWAFPATARPFDLGALVLSGAAILAGVLGAIPSLSGAVFQGYNLHPNDTLWQLSTLGLLLLGAILLYLRRPEGFGTGLAFAAVVLLAHALHLIFRQPGDYSGIVRVGHMAAFPLLLTLSQRSTAWAPDVQASAAVTEIQAAESGRPGTDPKVVHALLGLAGETDPVRLHRAMARAVSRAMQADVCLIVQPMADTDHISISTGYDLIREEYLRGAQVDYSLIPRLANAIQHGRAARFLANRIAGDVEALGSLLGLEEPGNLLSAPITTTENEVLGAVVLLSAYSQREWTGEDQTLLVSMAASLAPVIKRGREVERRDSERDGLGEALVASKAEVLQLQKRNDELSLQLETLALESEQAAAEVAEAAGLRASVLRSDARIRELEAALEIAKRSSQPATPDVGERPPSASRPPGASDRVAPALDWDAGGRPGAREAALGAAAISQELRQSLTAILGYTDLLLGESVGILGTLQRKFVERMRASTERAGSRLEKMIQLIGPELQSPQPEPEALDLNRIIDEALAQASDQIRRKKIAIHLHAPQSAGTANVDREVLQQILVHLLQNAGEASPAEGTIAIKVLPTMDQGRPHLMIQVKDSGGGIPEEQLPLIFRRRDAGARMEGASDRTARLAVARSLTETQRGRMWVENEPGVGATLCVLLPVALAPVRLAWDGESH